MILLGMMRFVEDQEVDLVKRDEGMHETLIQNLGGADYHHVIFEKLFPNRFGPKITPHFATKALDLLVQIAFQDRKLLKDQCDTVDLQLL